MAPFISLFLKPKVLAAERYPVGNVVALVVPSRRLVPVKAICEVDVPPLLYAEKFKTATEEVAEVVQILAASDVLNPLELLTPNCSSGAEDAEPDVS